MNIIVTEDETNFLKNVFYESSLYDWIPTIELEDGSYGWDENSFEYQTFLKIGMIGEQE